MKARVTVALLVALVLVTSANHLHGQKIKMIADQDARGPATTDMQSILIFLQSDFLCLTPKKKANAGKLSMASSAIRAAGAIFPIGRRARLLHSGPGITSLM